MRIKESVWYSIFIIVLLMFLHTVESNSQEGASEQKTDSDGRTSGEALTEETINNDIEDSKKNDDQGSDLTEEDDGGAISRTHRFFSESVLNVTNKFDNFWGDDRSIEEANRSRIWVRFDFDLEQGSGFDFIPNIRANIRIPKTRNRLHLFFNGEEGDEDELESDIKDNDESGTLFLRYFLFNSPLQSLGADSGIRIKSSGVSWFAGLRGRVYRTYGDWGFRITDKFRWFTDRKFTNLTRFDVERVIFKDNSFFRSSTFGRWFERKEGYFVEQNFQYFHKLAEKIGIILQWRTLGETKVDDFFKETRVRFRYRQNIHWRWLFAEVAPSIFWKEENDWDTDLGIRFRLEAHFGNLSKLKFF